MKKTILTTVLSLIVLFAIAQLPQFPHPALCFTVTGQANPTFISFKNLASEITQDDWIGCYDADTMLCYGAFRAEARNHYVGAYLDEQMTEKKDGFDNGDVISLFYYKALTKEFYSIAGTYVDSRTNNSIPELKCYPLGLYYVTDVQIGDKIQLAIDPELSEVVFAWEETTLNLKPGESNVIKLSFTKKNTTDPVYMVAIGKGKIEQKKGVGLFYKYQSNDVNVVINAVGQNNFTGEMVTSQLTLHLDQSILSNTIYSNDDFIIFLRGGGIWCKIVNERASVRLYRNDGGTEKLLYNTGLKPKDTEVRFISSNYPNFWKGQNIRYVVYYSVNGKLQKIPKEGNFIL